MNYFNRIPIPITFCSEEKVKDVYIRTYPDNEMHMLQDSYSIDKEKKEKCTLLWLVPGKCLFQFIISNVKHIETKKPIEKVDNDFFNVLIISKESTGLEIRVHSTDLNSNFKRLIDKNRDKSISIDDNVLATLSFKAENHVQECDKSIKIINDWNCNNTEYNKVIVYNYNNDYLIEMIMIPYESDNPNLICLKYENNPTAEPLIVSKNDIFYQNVKAFNNSIDISKYETINELSIMKAIHKSFINGKNYIVTHDLMMVFYSPMNTEFSLPSHMINAYMSIEESNMIIIRCKETEELIYRIKKANNSISDSLLYNIFALSKIIKEAAILHIIIDNNELQLNLIPLFHTDNKSINQNSILLNKELNQNKLVKISLEAGKEIHKMNFSNEDEQLIFEFCNYNARVINILYNIMSKSNLLHLFKDFFHGFLIGYLLLIHYKISEDSIEEMPEQTVNQSQLTFYSNLITLTILKTLFQLIPVQLKSNRKQHNQRLQTQYQSFLLIYESEKQEQNNLINDIIYRRSTTNHPINKSNNDLISNVLFKSLIEMVLEWKNRSSNYFLNEILSQYDIMFSSLLIFKPQAKEAKKKCIDHMISNIQQNYQLLQNSELKSPKIKQLWYVHIGVSYESFMFSDVELILNFIQSNKLIDYASNGTGKYFCHLSFKEFFKQFLPLLTDITSSYSSNFNYQMKLNHFFIDLQTLQQIEENFEITFDSVSFGFQTFEIMIKLILSLQMEKAITIQSKFRQYLMSRAINKMRINVINLQNQWRNYLYNSMTDANNNDLIPVYLINKYKKKDAVLIKYLLNIKKVTNSLTKDNEKLKQKYTMINCQQSTDFNFNSPMIKQNSIEFNKINLSSSSLFSLGIQNNYSKSNNMNNYFLESTPKVNNFDHPIQLFQTKENNSQKNQFFKENNETKILNEKIEESKRKYKDMIVLASEYEKKMDNLIALINSKEEVRDVLKRNGVQFN